MTNVDTAKHIYKGVTITECNLADWREHGGRWVVRYRHPSGLFWDESQCAHVRSLVEAKAAINADISYGLGVRR